MIVSTGYEHALTKYTCANRVILYSYQCGLSEYFGCYTYLVIERMEAQSMSVICKLCREISPLPL